MSTFRVFFKQSNVVYCFIRVIASTDGSLVVLFDRKFQSSADFLFENDSGPITEINEFKKKGDIRYTIHTTGMINYRNISNARSAIFIEPLYELTQSHNICLISIPKVNRLDVFKETTELDGKNSSFIELPPEKQDRISTEIAIGPKKLNYNNSIIFLEYEIYSLYLNYISNFRVPDSLENHFVFLNPKKGAFDKCQVDRGRAEIEFFRRLASGGPTILREASGAYVAIATSLMRGPPKLTVQFSKEGLTAEQISFENWKPVYKVRFWIRDKSGRNKFDDLRVFISYITLESEL